VSGKADDLISFEFVVDCAIGMHRLHERQVEEIKKFFDLFSQPMRDTIETRDPTLVSQELRLVKALKHREYWGRWG